MTSSYSMLDEKILKTINMYRLSIINGSKSYLSVKRNDFYLGDKEYLLISLIANFPYLQLLIRYGDGKKVDRACIVIDNIYLPISRKCAQKEVDAIRKYNGQLSNSRLNNMPCYNTTFSHNLICSINEMLEYYIKNYMEKTKVFDRDNIFKNYVDFCKFIDDQRKNVNNYKKRSLMK